MKTLRSAWLVLALTTAGCSAVIGASPGTTASTAAPAASTTAPQVIPPDTVIDGYTIGAPADDCPLTSAECAKLLALLQAGTINTAAGKAAIEKCALPPNECLRFTGSPESDGVSRAPGLGEIVGLAEAAMLGQSKNVDPATIVGFRVYSESLKPYIGPNGEWLAHRTGGYSIVVFEMSDGSTHAAGVGCVIGTCHAVR